jgi:UDP-3-O-[3-hydroxymyristoyl] glucosamine N-acyltransferase
VFVAVDVGVGVLVAVGRGVKVEVGLNEKVYVGDGVKVDDGVDVAVWAGVGDRVLVEEGVYVEVGVAPEPVTLTSSIYQPYFAVPLSEVIRNRMITLRPA